MNDIGDRLRKIRAALGLTQEGLAARMGVTVSAVSHWEQGTRQPSGQTLKMLGLLEMEADND